MRIKLEVSGGFAGLMRGCDLKVDDLSEEAAQRLRGLVEAAGLQESFDRHDKDARDALLYELTIEMPGEKTVTASFDQPSIPEACEPLIDALQESLRPIPLR